MYQHVTDLDNATAVENLVTAYKGYQDQLMNMFNGDSTKAIEYVADIFDKLGNEYAVTAADVGSALTKCASAMEVAGNSIQETSAMATGITEVTQNADKAGSALKILSMRLRGVEAKDLEELGEDTDGLISNTGKLRDTIQDLSNVDIMTDNGDFKSTYEIMDGIYEEWKEMRDTDKASLLEYDGCINFMKGAIECADKVTTVSPSYADEILDPWYSHGLDSILNVRRYKLSGILNGIDTVGYDPATDKCIKANFSADDISGKKIDKEELQKEMGLPVKPGVPVIGMVTRLVSHKGLDLVKRILDELLATSEMQLVVLGSGDYEYESYFRWIAEKYPDKVGLRIGFVPELARKIYAGADMFLMPSKSEPCGLSQMVALRYGTVPIVRETGGLRDSITDCGDGKGNGFTFKSYNAHDMLDAIRRALTLYYNGDWNELVLRALNCDFSWGRSANAYIRLYKETLKG